MADPEKFPLSLGGPFLGHLDQFLVTLQSKKGFGIGQPFDGGEFFGKDLTTKGGKIQFLKESLTFTGDNSPMAHLLLSVMGAVAEFERALFRERQMEGIALAKKKGKFKGRKKKLSDQDIDEIRSRAEAGEKKAELARVFEVSRETIYKVIRQE